MIEGSWDNVLGLIGKAHTLVHQNGVLRVQTDIRVGTRSVSLSCMVIHVSVVESERLICVLGRIRSSISQRRCRRLSLCLLVMRGRKLSRPIAEYVAKFRGRPLLV
jgi:hypothetical protein